MCVLDVEIHGVGVSVGVLGVPPVGVLVHGVNPLSSEVVGVKVDSDRAPCSEQLVGRVMCVLDVEVPGASVTRMGVGVTRVKSAPIASCSRCPIIAVWLSKRRSVSVLVDLVWK